MAWHGMRFISYLNAENEIQYSTVHISHAYMAWGLVFVFCICIFPYSYGKIKYIMYVQYVLYLDILYVCMYVPALFGYLKFKRAAVDMWIWENARA